MAVSAKKAASERRAKPNLMSRRERTRKEGKCQLCEASVPIKNQYTVVNDLEAGEPVARKNAGAKGQEKASHYCGECKDKRIAQKQAWINSRDGSTKPKASKKTAKKTATKKAVKKATKPKGKKAVKKTAKKGSKQSEPF